MLVAGAIGWMALSAWSVRAAPGLWPVLVLGLYFLAGVVDHRDPVVIHIQPISPEQPAYLSGYRGAMTQHWLFLLAIAVGASAQIAAAARRGDRSAFPLGTPGLPVRRRPLTYVLAGVTGGVILLDLVLQAANCSVWIEPRGGERQLLIGRSTPAHIVMSDGTVEHPVVYTWQFGAVAVFCMRR